MKISCLSTGNASQLNTRESVSLRGFRGANGREASTAVVPVQSTAHRGGDALWSNLPCLSVDSTGQPACAKTHKFTFESRQLQTSKPTIEKKKTCCHLPYSLPFRARIGAEAIKWPRLPLYLCFRAFFLILSPPRRSGMAPEGRTHATKSPAQNSRRVQIPSAIPTAASRRSKSATSRE